MADRRVVIVGAGVGGLAAAIDLARRGLQVTVLERAGSPGGKLRQVMAGGAPVDSGPTVFTMRWVFDGLYADAGTSLASQLSLSPLAILARHAWPDGSRLDLHADVHQSAQAIGELSGAAESRRFLAFCREARRVYEALEGPYIRSSRPTALSLTRDLGLHGTGVLAALGPFRKMWGALSRHFHDGRLQQLFGRYATYCGSSPFEAPATLMLVAQVEMQGVWAVQGGMIALAQSLAALAQARGATVRCNVQVERIVVEGHRVRGVRLADGELIAADEVVFNGDAGALGAGLLGPDVQRAVPPVPRSARSLSALTWSIHARARGFPLVRHNVFFDADYASEFRDIFGAARLPLQPTVYVCAQDRDDQAQDRNTDRLLCLVNAPATGDAGGVSDAQVQACGERAFALLARSGLQVDRRDDNTVITTPQAFERLFPATGGALYGRASHGWMSAFARPEARSAIPGLWLAGGSAHPGAGVPMAALSGRLAAASLMNSLGAHGSGRNARITLARQPTG